MTAAIEKLEARTREIDSRRERLEKRMREMDEEYRALGQERDRIQDRIQAEKLKELIGKPVKTASESIRSKYAWMNDAVGTLVKVDQTLCVVDYGDVGKEHGYPKYRLPIHEVIPADQERTAAR